MSGILLPRKINYKTLALFLTLISFALFTLWHCLYLKPIIEDCSLGFLAIHLYTEKNQLRQVVTHTLLSLFTAAIFIYFSNHSKSLTKYFLNIKLYLKEKLFISSHCKLFDPLRRAYSKGIINSKIYPIH